MVEELIPQLINLLKKWAKNQNHKQFSNFYIFGSLINGGGNQFLQDISDIDLIVIIQNNGSLTRARLCQKLQKAKFELELLLRPILQRKNKNKSVVSLVLVTNNEVIWDVHKSKSPRFFRENKNNFLNLLEGSDKLTSVGLKNREALLDIIQAIEKAQDYRNKYLSINSNKPKEYNEQDIFPKDLARSAAQVHSFAVKNENKKFDINSGSSYLMFLLKQKDRKTSNEWSQLNSKVEERVNRSRERPALNDFDLLLLHELLFDKACALLKQNSSSNSSKSRHLLGSRRNLFTPSATKKTSEVKTKSKSSTVTHDRKKTSSTTTTKLATEPSIARNRGKTPSVASAKPGMGKKTSTISQKTTAKNGTPRNTGLVKSPGHWIMLNENFFLTEKIRTKPDQSIELQLSPTADIEQVVELKSLYSGKSHNSKQISYADQSNAGMVQVLFMESELSGRKTRFNITLTPIQRSHNSYFGMEIGYSRSYNPDEIAELRARQMLLAEPLPEELASLSYTTQKEIFPELWVKLQKQPRLFLPKAWLKAVHSLKTNGIVEDVLELELGTIRNRIMRVRFQGRRQASANQSGGIIKFEGSCILDK
ncbi:MAG: hypothetical protein KME12_19225 [Trichocoleus desertorum ATA4-8-CV12]|nr:hypothetical protein [Trichocoleus desertorum ATA4-8-CV12]